MGWVESQRSACWEQGTLRFPPLSSDRLLAIVENKVTPETPRI